MATRRSCWLQFLLSAMLAGAIDIQADNVDSIKAGSRLLVQDMMGYYTGDQPGQTPGFLPGNSQPGGYFWWIGGGMFNTMINYWYRTGDDTWNDATRQALYWQSDPGSGGYFSSPNVSQQLGNDDQAFWAMAAMSAAEYKFPNPPAEYPSWLAMAQGVFNQQLQRWDNLTCNGGLRWQVFLANAGYDYKNSISNGCFFNLAARLAKYTGNETYAEWAIKTWDWSVDYNLIEPEVRYRVIDGISSTNCTAKGNSNDMVQWTYNVGVYLLGAAAMWNASMLEPANTTAADMWKTRTEGLLDGASIFLRDSDHGAVLTEQVCEPSEICKVDQTTFKAYLARWMYASAEMAPYITPTVFQMLGPSVQAAAASCTAPGKNGGTACGQKWYTDGFDGKTGIGMQMNALEVLINLITMPGPVQLAEGISTSDPGAGSQDLLGTPVIDDNVENISKADQAGAIILTILMSALTIGMGVWSVF